MTIWQKRLLLIAAFFAAIALARFVDGLSGLPVAMAAIILAFWIYLARQIWLSRHDGLKDLRYTAAMGLILVTLTAFAAVSIWPLFDAIMLKLG